MKNTVSFRDIYQIIDEFRQENNNRFDKIEQIFANFHKEEFVPLEKRISNLEKLADRALFFILLVSGVIAATWQVGIGWIKKQFNL